MSRSTRATSVVSVSFTRPTIRGPHARRRGSERAPGAPPGWRSRGRRRPAMKVRLGPADFAEQEMRGYEVERRNVCVARIGGRYKALDDWCNHAGCLLSG